METYIKADIFFFITSVATVVLAILGSIVLFYLIKSGRNLYLLSEALKERLEDNIVFRLFFPPSRKRRYEKIKDIDKV